MEKLGHKEISRSVLNEFHSSEIVYFLIQNNSQWLFLFFKIIDSKQNIEGNKSIYYIDRDLGIKVRTKRTKSNYKIEIIDGKQIIVESYLQDKNSIEINNPKRGLISNYTLNLQDSLYFKLYRKLFETNENELIRNEVIRDAWLNLLKKYDVFEEDLIIELLMSQMLEPSFKISTLPSFLESIYFKRADLIKRIPINDELFKPKIIEWFITYGFDELNFQVIFEKDSLLAKIKDKIRICQNKIALIGFSNRVVGISQNIKYFERALDKSKKEYRVFDIPNSQLQYQKDTIISDFNYRDYNIDNYKKRVFFLNPVELDQFLERTNISQGQSYAYWAWELEDFPTYLEKNTSHFAGIWSISNFSSRAISKSTGLQVETIHIPLAEKLSNCRDKSKIYFENFFLFIFDYLSDFERKNPISVVLAFKAAFPKQKKGLGLVIKCSNHDLRLEYHKLLKREIGERTDILLITQILTDTQIESLIKSCLSYISLHRSEGFGISLAQSMLNGKPVVATGYSGNLDYMDEKNSFLVNYSLVSTDNAVEKIYKGAKSSWAEPDLEHAAFYLSSIYEDHKSADKVAQIGRENAMDLFSAKRFSKRIRILLKK